MNEIDEEKIREVNDRVHRAPHVHYYPDVRELQIARAQLLARLDKAPEHRTEAARIRYLEEAVRPFERVARRVARYRILPTSEDEEPTL